MPQEKIQTKLTKEQIQAVALLSVGACLESFDRMLYVHTAMVLNELFFPQAEAFIKAFIPAFAFCSSYFLTPLGAIFFGYIGDSFGRKTTIVTSSLLMSLCCVTVAFLPSYQQIGISATIILTVCRMLQSMSGISEITGVEIYLTESIKPPAQYPIVALVGVFQKFGGTLALLTVAFFANAKFLPPVFSKDGWRIAFLVGALIGVVGGIARRSLKEASEFADRQRLLKAQFKKADIKWSQGNPAINPKISLSTSIAYFFGYCTSPLCFYFVFLHCPEILKNTFNMSPAQIISNNLWPTTFNTLAGLSVALLSYKVSPLKILKIKLLTFLFCIAIFPTMIKVWHTPKTVLIFQCLLIIFRFEYIPATPIFLRHFPVLKRFRYSSVIGCLAKTFSSIFASFGLALVTSRFGLKGALLIFIPVGLCFAWGIYHFEKKESAEQNDAMKKYKVSFTE